MYVAWNHDAWCLPSLYIALHAAAIWQSQMAPKSWSAQITITVEQLVPLLVESTTILERCGWKAMDPLQFGDHCGALLEGIGRRTIRVSKGDLAEAIKQAKLNISSAEAALLVEKISTCIGFIKQKLRDASSGKNLPSICMRLYKLWKKHHGRGKKLKRSSTFSGAKAGKVVGKADGSSSMDMASSMVGRASKDGNIDGSSSMDMESSMVGRAVASSKDGNIDGSSSMATSSIDVAKDIRATLGLKPNFKKAEGVDILSLSSSSCRPACIKVACIPPNPTTQWQHFSKGDLWFDPLQNAFWGLGCIPLNCLGQFLLLEFNFSYSWCWKIKPKIVSLLLSGSQIGPLLFQSGCALCSWNMVCAMQLNWASKSKSDCLGRFLEVVGG